MKKEITLKFIFVETQKKFELTCKPDEKIVEICQKFSKKYQLDLNKIFFLLEGRKLEKSDYEKSISEFVSLSNSGDLNILICNFDNTIFIPNKDIKHSLKDAIYLNNNNPINNNVQPPNKNNDGGNNNNLSKSVANQPNNDNNNPLKNENNQPNNDNNNNPLKNVNNQPNDNNNPLKNNVNQPNNDNSDIHLAEQKKNSKNLEINIANKSNISINDKTDIISNTDREFLEANAIFKYKGKDYKVKCLTKSRMYDISRLFTNQNGFNFETLKFSYKSQKLNFSKAFEEIADENDKKN